MLGIRLRNFLVVSTGILILLSSALGVLLTSSVATTYTEVYELTSPNSQTEFFGASMALSSNGLLVVGAPLENLSNFQAAGAVYVFNASSYDLITYIPNPDPQNGSNFGDSVAISGNLLVVADASGHAYVFNSTTGVRVSTLQVPTSGSLGLYSWSVAVNGSLVIVGAPDVNYDGYAQSGEAFFLNATTGSLITNITSPYQPSGWFGFSVAINGTIAVIGSPQDPVNGIDVAGRIYLFNTTTKSMISAIDSPCPRNGEFFGSSVALDGSYIAVGALGDPPSGGYNGRVYILNSSTNNPVSNDTVDSCNIVTSYTSPSYYAHLGTNIAIYGETVLSGAPYETINGSNSGGAVYVINATNGALIAHLTSDVEGGSFGSSVALNADMIFAGADAEGPKNNYSGTVYLFGISAQESSSYLSTSTTSSSSSTSSIESPTTYSSTTSTASSTPPTMTITSSSTISPPTTTNATSSSSSVTPSQVSTQTIEIAAIAIVTLVFGSTTFFVMRRRHAN